MAGLKNRSKSETGNPNMVLVIALILFVLTSIGLGLLAYYGYDGQEALRAETKAARVEASKAKLARDQDEFGRMMAMMAIGLELTEADRAKFVNHSRNFQSNPDSFSFDELKATLSVMKKGFEDDLKLVVIDQEKGIFKFENNYLELAKAANADYKKAKAMLDLSQKEFNDYKSSYEVLMAKVKKDNEKMLEDIAAGNKIALEQALKTNTKFGDIQDLAKKLQDQIKKLDEEHIAELADRDQQLVRLKIAMQEMEKKLNDRSQGLATATPTGSGELHALMLDISKGYPLWDLPRGKVIRVDPINMLVYVDLGSKSGIRPDVTFNVFTTNAAGRADRQLRATIEVVRVLNETSSVCRITSLYTDKGEPVPLNSEGARANAIRAVESLIREGDLLFNMFFDMHVFIAGNVNFVGTNADSPATQNMQLNDFIAQLRKMNIVVDGYINLLNGQIEGAITPKTRLLIRGDIAQLNGSPDETNRYKQVLEAYQVAKRQAMDQGMFIISAQNFAHIAGYRSVQAQVNPSIQTPFRPSLPWTGGPRIQQREMIVDAPPPAAPPAPMPAPMPQEMKKE